MPSFSSLSNSSNGKTETGDKKSFCNWMSMLKSSGLDQVPLHNLFIPGSHDSGAYKLYPKLGFAVDRPDLRKSWFLNAFHFITYPLVARYSITQRLNVFQQLESGIRYLDIRVALRPEDGQFYICHNFYGPKLEEILEQVCAYVKKYPLEVLVLDFQHVHNFGNENDHRRLYDLLVRNLRENLVSTSAHHGKQSISLHSLWSGGERVFAFYRHPFQKMCSQLLWPADLLPNPWANTRNPVELKSFLEENILNRPTDGKLFVSQGVLTPNSSYVVRNFFGSLESKLTLRANSLLYELIVRERCGCTNKDGTFGPNIVMFDFVDWKRYKLVDSIVRLNQLLLANQSAENTSE